MKTLLIIILASLSTFSQPGYPKDPRTLMEIPENPNNPKFGSAQADSTFKKEKIEEINEKFSISEIYLKKYERFLSRKDTGIARIFPDAQCGNRFTVSVSDFESCKNLPQVSGNGARYSIKLNKIPSFTTKRFTKN